MIWGSLGPDLEGAGAARGPVVVGDGGAASRKLRGGWWAVEIGGEGKNKRILGGIVR